MRFPFPIPSPPSDSKLLPGSYNTTYLTLEWEEHNPVHCRDELTLTEFSLVGEPVISTAVDKVYFDKDAMGDFRKYLLQRRCVRYNRESEKSVKNIRQQIKKIYPKWLTRRTTNLLLAEGNYSSLIVTFRLQRESGFYIYDYFIPSILLVVVSWVSFWLEPDAPVVSGRVVLGTVESRYESKFLNRLRHPPGSSPLWALLPRSLLIKGHGERQNCRAGLSQSSHFLDCPCSGRPRGRSFSGH